MAAESPDPNLTDELRKLADLHREGHLTDHEFAHAKSRLLGQTTSAPPLSVVVERDRLRPAPVAPGPERTYKSSRWSSGNLFFPDRITLSRDGIVFRKGALFGSSEENISYPAVASFKVSNGVFLSNITIETSGGSQPIFVNGLWKSAAKEIQETLRTRQRVP
jgi:hypothetical protein